MTTQHLKFSLKFSFIHLLASVCIALSSAWLVFYQLYPAPFYQLLGVSDIFLILMGVDIICGPVLTLIIANPKKPKKEILTDITLIGLIQLSALSYGLISVHQARPVMIVFETDRFVLVQANEVQTNEMNDTPDEFKPLKWMGVRMAGTREAKSGEEMLNSVETALAGIDISLRPNWWINYDQTKPSVINRAKNIATLIDKHPEQRGLIEDKLSELNLPPEKAFYLPFVSSKNLEWTAILDDNANIIGYLNLSGF